MNDISKPLAITYDAGDDETKPLPKKESVTLDIGQVLACCELLPTGKEKDGDAKRIVHVHATDGKVRIVSLDGANMLICTRACTEPPSWAEKGVVLHGPSLKTRAKFIAGEDNANCVIGWDGASGTVDLSSPSGDIVMRVGVDETVTFPDYEMLLAQLDFSASFQDFEGFGLNTAVAKSLAALASRLTIAWANSMKPKANEGHRLKVFPAGPNKPLAVEFCDVPGALLIVMPRAVDQSLSATARDLLTPAAKGTLAALRAHKTRTEVALRKAKTARDKNELAAKVADYERRIARVMAAAGVAIEDKSHQAA